MFTALGLPKLHNVTTTEPVLLVLIRFVEEHRVSSQWIERMGGLWKLCYTLPQNSTSGETLLAVALRRTNDSSCLTWIGVYATMFTFTNFDHLPKS